MTLNRLVQYRWIVFLTGMIFISSCEIINPTEDIPSYISIEEFSLNTNSNQGPDNHMITDAWIYVNGEDVGLYELPCKVPVLASGNVEIIVFPGIKNNGIAASRVKYPFYQKYVTSIELIPEQVHVIQPVTSYYDETAFDWFENFQDPGVSLDTLVESNVAFRDTLDNGSRVGLISMKNDDDFIRINTIDEFTFPDLDNHELYLEMDYIANNMFTVGLFIDMPGEYINQPVIFMNPIDHWNKIYIDLSYFSQTMSAADNYTVYIEASKNDTIENAIIMMDNLKLVRFE